MFLSLLLGCSGERASVRSDAEQPRLAPEPSMAPSDDPVALEVEPREAQSALPGSDQHAERVDQLLQQSSSLERYLEEQVQQRERLGPAQAGLVREGRALLVELREVQAGLLLAKGERLEDEERLQDLEVRLFRVRGAASVAFRDRE